MPRHPTKAGPAAGKKPAAPKRPRKKSSDSGKYNQRTRELFRAMTAGDRNARGQLMEENMGLVGKIANNFEGRELSREDLVSEGKTGLVRAINGFDPLKRKDFSAYAGTIIKRQMRLAIANQARTVRVPAGTRIKTARILKARNGLEGELGREATIKEVAEKTGLPEKTVNKNWDVRNRMVSIHDPEIISGERTMEEFSKANEMHATPEIYEKIERQAMRQKLSDVFRALRKTSRFSKRNKGIWFMIRGTSTRKPENCAIIAKRFDLSRNRVWQIVGNIDQWIKKEIGPKL